MSHRIRRSKYHAVPTVVSEIGSMPLRFASKREAARWQALRVLERAGKIRGLRRQVRMPLTVQDTLIGHYVADFRYEENGVLVTEDCKGYRTPMYRWKARHVAAQYGIEIRET